MLKETEKALKDFKKFTNEFVVIHDTALDVVNSNNNAILNGREILVSEYVKNEILNNNEFEYIGRECFKNNLGYLVEYDAVVYKEHIYFIYTKVGNDNYETMKKHKIKAYDLIIPEPEYLLETVLDYSRTPYLIVEQRAYLSLLIYIDELTDEEINLYYKYVRHP